MAEEKKGLLVRLFGGQKKSSCCSVKFEEIPEDEESETPEQIRSASRGSSCCGPAFEVRDAGPGSK